jgi:hypothetical protein
VTPDLGPLTSAVLSSAAPLLRCCRAPPDDVCHPGALGSTIPWDDRDPSATHPAALLPPPPKDAERASEMKALGNKHYAAQEYEDAIECYSEAVDMCPFTADFSYSLAVYLSNRAACFLNLDRWDDAIADCTAAIEASPTYVKVQSHHCPSARPPLRPPRPGTCCLRPPCSSTSLDADR